MANNGSVAPTSSSTKFGFRTKWFWLLVGSLFVLTCFLLVVLILVLVVDGPGGGSSATFPTSTAAVDPKPSVTTIEPNANNVFAMDDQSLAALYAQDTPSGIWSWASYQPHKANRRVYPGLRGVPIFIWWKHLETTRGVYDWSKVDGYVETAAKNNLYFSFETWVGPHAPTWLYDVGVPKVRTTQPGWEFPYYFNELYLESFDKLNREALNHLLSMSERKKEKLVMVVLNEGSTGDPYCYKGDPLDSLYSISRNDWNLFRQEHYQKLHDYLGPNLDSIPIAFTHLASTELQEFIFRLFPRMYQFKNGMASHGYHIAEQEWQVDHDSSRAFDGVPTLGGTRLHYFGEMDREWLNGWFQRAPVQSMYWSALYALHRGLSRWQVRDDALAVEEMHFAFDFFNQYAPYLDASASPFAFCALREGLDASDASKFPESRYGPVQGNPLSRVKSILEDYQMHGAVVEDESVTGQSAMGFRQRSGYVDVFYGGVGANYHKFLYQIDPDEESIGWWHVGNHQESPYGRFARSFDARARKVAMYFRLDDRFVSDKRAPHSVTVSVIYYDGGNGVWEFLYNDFRTGGEQSAATITCGGTDNWKKIQVVLHSAVLDGGLEKGADFILGHVQGDDTKFHMIEVEEHA